MSITSWRAIPRACLALSLTVAGGQAIAQYPERPITYVMSAGAGSAPDTLMRVILADASKRLGVPIVVENRTGGAGLIAMQYVAGAQADGYTIGHGNTQTLGISPSLSQPSKAAAQRLELIVQVGYTTNLLSVKPGLAVNSVQELIQYAKANPGRLTYGSAGNGTSGHVGAELFKSLTGTEIMHVPYKAAPAAVADVIAGHVDMIFDNIASSLPSTKNGKLKPLAVTSLKRSPLMPETPTVDESGLAGFEVIAWSGLVGPKGMPAAVSAKLAEAINASVKSPEIMQRMREVGYEPVGGDKQDFERWVDRERSKWEKVIKAANIGTD